MKFPSTRIHDGTCTAHFVAELMDVSVRTVNKRAQTEQWQHIHRRTRGGFQKVFMFVSLPADIRTSFAVQARQSNPLPSGKFAMAGAECGIAYENEAKLSASLKQKNMEAGMAKFAALPIEKQKEAQSRFLTLKARDAFISSAKMPVKRGSEVFCKEVKAGRLPLPDGVEMSLSKNGKLKMSKLKLSWTSLNRWRAAFEEQGLYGLVPKYKTVVNTPDVIQTSITPAMQEFIIGMKVDKPHVAVPKIMQGLNARFDGQDIPHNTTVRRFMSRWEEQNKSLLLFCANPDDWKNRYMFALGSADEAIERLNQRWELDSTPGDVMLIDGRHSVIGSIDIYSRRLKLIVSKTSNSAAIAALIRNCLIDWGVPEDIKTDNGADYVSNHIVRVLGNLEITQWLCKPFAGEEKPFIERALGTFSHDIVELLPGYVGHSVADRKAIEARRSFAQRIMKQGEAVEVNMTAAEFQVICDRWVKAIYHENPHSGLNKRTPAQMAREWKTPIREIENERALDLLLYPAPDSDGHRFIKKKGVTVGKLNYQADEFIGYEGQRVLVLVDPTDLGTVYCYLESGQFLCRAVEPSLVGLDRAECAAHRKNKQKQFMNEGRKGLNKLKNKIGGPSLYLEILEHRERQIENIEDFPHPSIPYTTDALEQAARAVDDIKRETSGPQPIEITPEQEAVANEVIALADHRPETPLFSNDWEKYEFYDSALRAGDEVEDEVLAWMKRFEITLENEDVTHGFN